MMMEQIQEAPHIPETLRPLAVPISQLRPHPRNARVHADDEIKASLYYHGQYRPIVVAKDGVILAGNGTYAAAMELGWTEMAVTFMDVASDHHRALRILLVDNRLNDIARYDEGLLASLVTSVPDLMGTGWDQAAMDELLESVRQATENPLDLGDQTASPTTRDEARKTLAERFIVPPFSVLDARQGYWQARKKAWILLGIRGELGRGLENVGMAHPDTTATTDFYRQKRTLEEEMGREISKDEAAALMADRGTLKDSRAANQARKGAMVSFSGDDPMAHQAAYSAEEKARRGALQGGSGEDYRYAKDEYTGKAPGGKPISQAPGGSRMPSATLGADGKTQRGDAYGRPATGAGDDQKMRNGKGRGRTFGQDIMKGEHTMAAQGDDQAQGAAGPGMDTATPGKVKGGRSPGALYGATDKPWEEMSDFERRVARGGDTVRVNQSSFGGRPPHGPRVTQNPDGSLHYEESNQGEAVAGTSVFDPVLCEIAYRWFCPAGGRILDPFAGGCTRGVVATYLGYGYTGIELRPEQVAVNVPQAAALGLHPEWVLGDSSLMDTFLPMGQDYDLIFTCPPYYDLEIYSQSEKDGSAFETYETFLPWYRSIFSQAVSRLKDNRFVVVVVGEVRNRATGVYRNFVADTVACFNDLGLQYYNEAILITSFGSLAIRVGRQFETGRKLGKTHQNVLVFYKGNPKEIRQHFASTIEFGLPEHGTPDLFEGDGPWPGTIDIDPEDQDEDGEDYGSGPVDGVADGSQED